MRIEEIADALAVLADANRLRILHLLFRRQSEDLDVSTIVEVLNVPQPRVSRHLQVLKKHGFVDVEESGRRRCYRLADLSPALHQTVLAAIEPFVQATRVVRGDTRRSAPVDEGAVQTSELTARDIHATQSLRMSVVQESPTASKRNDLVFHALSQESRRVLLDVVEKNPGAASAFVTQFVDMSRQAAERHLDVLEEAGLLDSERQGRERHFFYNPMPLQLIYERWTDESTAHLARHLSRVKRRAENA